MPRIRYPAGSAPYHQGRRAAGYPGDHLYSRSCRPTGRRSIQTEL